MVHCIYLGAIGYDFNLSLKIDFVLANSDDPDEMPHYVAFHLGGHCLPKTHLGVGLSSSLTVSGFPQALEIMENLENHEKSSIHGKIMKPE